MILKPIRIENNVSQTPSKRWKHLYQCFCGKFFESLSQNIKTGATKSCGCYKLAKKELKNDIISTSR